MTYAWMFKLVRELWSMLLDLVRRLFRRSATVTRIGWAEAGYSVYLQLYDEVVDIKTLLKSQPDRAAALESEAAFHSLASEHIADLKQQADFVAEQLRNSQKSSENWSITLLVDHSGSMKGPNAEIAALVAEGFNFFAQSMGCRFEVLGFTTVGWKGGRSRRDWLAYKGRANPGRLCDLRHIVYSAFNDTTFAGMTGLFTNSLLRENVDGEALEWALWRLRNEITSRKLLIYVSDGAPVDDSTLHENPKDILLRHLKEVLKETSAANDVQLFAVGIGRSVRELMSNSVELNTFDSVTSELFPGILSVITGGDHHAQTAYNDR